MSMVFTKILDFLCLIKAPPQSQAFSFAFVNYLPKQNENYRNTYKLSFDDHRVLVWNVLLYQGEPVTPPLPALSLQRKNWAVTDRKGNGPRIVRSQTFSFTHSYWEPDENLTFSNIVIRPSHALWYTIHPNIFSIWWIFVDVDDEGIFVVSIWRRNRCVEYLKAAES